MANQRAKAETTDAVGQKVEIGDIVAYARTVGRSADLNIALVTEVYTILDYNNKPTHPRIQVWSHSGWRSSFLKADPNELDYNKKSKMRKNTIGKHDNVIVIKDQASLGNSKMANALREMSVVVKNGGSVS